MRHESPNNKTTTWLTPPHVLKALGEFDLDPCCPPNMPWKTAAIMLTEKEDGLKAAWTGKRVFCNPPYGREAAAWLKKMADHQNGILLIFARTETSAFFSSVWGRATAMFFLRGRLRFHDHQGKPGDTAPAPSVLIAYDHPDDPTFNAQALRDCGLDGFFVDLTDAEIVWKGWRTAVWQALHNAGRPLKLDEIYAAVMATVRRPTNKNQKAKIRQTLYIYERRYFKRLGDRWSATHASR